MTTFVNEIGIVCALGAGKASVANALLAGSQGGMVASDAFSPGRMQHLGRVKASLHEIGPPHGEYACRTNRLLLAALAEIRKPVAAAIDRFGPHRVGVALGTSTSGIDAGEAAIRSLAETGAHPPEYHFHQQQLSGGSDFLCALLELTGPSLTIATACSSSAHALASARRLLVLGICDAVIAGGADALCNLTVQGFASLDATSAGLCNPFSGNRDGINLGEGAALMLVTREAGAIALLGVGNSSDAHHISAPDPTGAGARRAMRAALAQGGVDATEIDYVNLHGTGTLLNDPMEAAAVAELFGGTVWCGSSKPLTGHTLGAAGAIETALCWLLLHPEFNPEAMVAPHRYDGTRDPDIAPLRLAGSGAAFDRPPRYALSNSFAFGGNNAAVLIGSTA